MATLGFANAFLFGFALVHAALCLRNGEKCEALAWTVAAVLAVECAIQAGMTGRGT